MVFSIIRVKVTAGSEVDEIEDMVLEKKGVGVFNDGEEGGDHSNEVCYSIKIFSKN